MDVSLCYNMRPLRSHIIIHNSGKIFDFSPELQRLIGVVNEKRCNNYINAYNYFMFLFSKSESMCKYADRNDT